MTMVTFHHRDSLPLEVNRRSPRQVFPITLIFPTRPPTLLLPLPRVQRPIQPGEGQPRTMVAPQQIAHGRASDSRGGGYKPTLASDQDGGELAHSRDPGFVVAAGFLRVYRQASRCVLLHFTLASAMTCLPLVTLARYRWHYISHLGPFSYGISQRRYGVSREQAAVHHPYGDRSSASSYPLRYPCSLLANLDVGVRRDSPRATGQLGPIQYIATCVSG